MPVVEIGVSAMSGPAEGELVIWPIVALRGSIAGAKPETAKKDMDSIFNASDVDSAACVVCIESPNLER